MRLKTFSAKTMQDVMEAVRRELGPDAIIVSIDQGKKVGGVRVTAAVEGNAAPPSNGYRNTEPQASPAVMEEQRPQFVSRDYDKADVTAVLNHHGFPFDMASRLQEAAEAMDASSLPEAFAGALETIITCGALGGSSAKPLMLVGPPGAGKTVTCAKLAAEAVLNRSHVRLISTDTVKSGGVQQLDHFAGLMKLSVTTAADANELSGVLRRPTDHELTLIDTSGVNPFDMEEIQTLARLVKVSNAEPVLVLPAGMDPMEASDMAAIFAQLGSTRFVATRLDVARRFASVVTAARGGRLTLAGLSRTPYVAEGLETPTPLLFARILSALPRLGARPTIPDSERNESVLP